MSDALEVRRLGSDDLLLLRELNSLFATAFEDPASYASAPPADSYLQSVLSREHVIALVAILEGHVVGGLVAYVLDKLEQQRGEIYIYDLAVDEAHRRAGIAKGLIERVRSIAAEIGVWMIYVQADLEDAPAIRLYEGLGRREDVLHFDIPPARTSAADPSV